MKYNKFEKNYNRIRLFIFVIDAIVLTFWVLLLILFCWVGYTLYTTGASSVGNEIGAFFGSIVSSFKETSQ